MPFVTRETSRYFGIKNGQWVTKKPLNFDVRQGTLKDPRFIGVKQLVIEWNDSVQLIPTQKVTGIQKDTSQDFSGYISCKGCKGFDNEEGQIMIFAKSGFQIEIRLYPGGHI